MATKSFELSANSYLVSNFSNINMKIILSTVVPNVLDNFILFLTVLWFRFLTFAARFLSVDALKNYLEENIFPRLKKKPFSVLYLHTQVQKSEDFPGISALRSIYDVIPINARDNLQAIYFVHPSLQAKLFLATFGRLHFGSR